MNNVTLQINTACLLKLLRLVYQILLLDTTNDGNINYETFGRINMTVV